MLVGILQLLPGAVFRERELGPARNLVVSLVYDRCCGGRTIQHAGGVETTGEPRAASDLFPALP